MSEVTKGGTEVLVNIQKMLTCREKVGGSQRIPLLTKEGEIDDESKSNTHLVK